MGTFRLVLLQICDNIDSREKHGINTSRNPSNDRIENSHLKDRNSKLLSLQQLRKNSSDFKDKNYPQNSEVYKHFMLKTIANYKRRLGVIPPFERARVRSENKDKGNVFDNLF